MKGFVLLVNSVSSWRGALAGALWRGCSGGGAPAGKGALAGRV